MIWHGRLRIWSTGKNCIGRFEIIILIYAWEKPERMLWLLHGVYGFLTGEFPKRFFVKM